MFPQELATAFQANDLEVLHAGVPIEFEEVAQQEDGPHTSLAETYEFLKGLNPVVRMGEIKEGVGAVLFLTDATFTTGEILRVDGGAHAGKW